MRARARVFWVGRSGSIVPVFNWTAQVAGGGGCGVRRTAQVVLDVSPSSAEWASAGYKMQERTFLGACVCVLCVNVANACDDLTHTHTHAIQLGSLRGRILSSSAGSRIKMSVVVVGARTRVARVLFPFMAAAIREHRRHGSTFLCVRASVCLSM